MSALHADLTVMTFDDPLDDRKSEACALLARRAPSRAALERAEQLLDFLGRQPLSLVADRIAP
jgi:hypothetical protein